MSRKNKESSILSDRFYEKVFKIKLKGTQEIPLNNDFMKAIEQEYAIKYLESLSIEPTKANIAMILKANPLKNCKFGAGWNSSGRVADTLTIIAREKKSKLPSDSKAQGLDVEETKAEKPEKKAEKETKQVETKTGKEESKGMNESNKLKGFPLKRKSDAMLKFMGGLDEQENAKKEEEHKFQLDFNIDTIKGKYLYPFNENKQRKAYQNLMDDPTTSYLPQIEKGNTNDVLNSFKYYFPFSHVKVSSQILKDLQAPLKVTTADIVNELKKFIESFPFHVFPQQNTKPESEHTTSTFQTPPDSRVSEKAPPINMLRPNTFLKDIDIIRCKNILTTEELARILGVVAHLSYWQVFGHLNPVQPDLITKKQMILISMEQLNILRKRVKNPKLWSLFMLPMVVLTIRMMTEFFLRNNYTAFFELEKAGAVAFEKLNLLITNMFDPNMLYSRFAFFESEIEAVNKKALEHLNETKFRAKRIYGTNPYIDLYFPRPETDFVRNIRQKKHPTYGKSDKHVPVDEGPVGASIGTEEQENKDTAENKEYLQHSYKVKMFQVLLDKIDDNIGNKYKVRSNVINFDREKLTS